MASWQLDLHTRQEKSDWEYIAASDRTMWQHTAAKTRGIVTPANLVTISGLGLVLFGLALFANGSHTAGIAAIAAGRAADVADGAVAEYTRTKSNFGELLDVSVDKIALVAVAAGMLLWLPVPAAVIAAIVALNGYNGLVGLYAKAKRVTIHPSRSGKLATALCWLVIVLLLVTEFYAPSSYMTLIYSVFALYVGLGLVSAYSYTRELARQLQS